MLPGGGFGSSWLARLVALPNAHAGVGAALGAAATSGLRHVNATGPSESSAAAPARSVAHLAYEEVRAGHTGSDQPSRTVVVLHGLLGSGRNWRSWSKALVERAAKAQQGAPWRAVLVDLRCHGGSARLPGFAPPHSMATAAADVADLIRHKLLLQQHHHHHGSGHHGRHHQAQAQQQHGGSSTPPTGGATAPPIAVLGHSLGGKVALELLAQMASGTAGCSAPPQVWVLDSQPGLVADDLDSQTGVARVLHEVHSIPLPIPSRPWLMEHLKSRGFSPAISQWLGSNVVADGKGHLVWAFDARGATDMYHSYRSTDTWGICSRPPSGTSLHLVQGERSDRWPPQTLVKLKATAAAAPGAPGAGRFLHHVLPSAGHWVHADNPQGLLDIVLPHLLQQQ